MEIGEKLRFVRDLLGLRLEDVAKALDINGVTLSQYERGTRQVPYVLVGRLLRFYGVDERRFQDSEPWRRVEAARAAFDRERGGVLVELKVPPRSALRSGNASALRSDPEANAARGDEVRGPLRSGLFARQAGAVAVPA